MMYTDKYYFSVPGVTHLGNGCLGLVFLPSCVTEILTEKILDYHRLDPHWMENLRENLGEHLSNLPSPHDNATLASGNLHQPAAL